jgi:hypothetical protein
MTTMARRVGAEVLDALAPGEPAAIRSRRDLARIHRAMGTRSILLRALRGWMPAAGSAEVLHVLEIGAGDGRLLLGLARALAPDWPPVALTLLDRQDVVAAATIAEYSRHGWRASARAVDVFDWAAPGADPLLSGAGQGRWDLVVANLFLHHFRGPQLAGLLGAVAGRADRFLACEPRRGPLALAASHLVAVLGANAVTRADAVSSVRAGFAGRELLALWPVADRDAWELQEAAARPFSHCLRARRLAAGPARAR